MGGTVRAAGFEPRELTILIYAAGDEADIEVSTGLGLKRFERIRGLKAGSRVSIVAQHDATGEDANYRYALEYVAKPNRKRAGPDAPPVAEALIDEIQREIARVRRLPEPPPFRYGERDSGNPVTLKQFLEWGVVAYPARHYVLILSGHAWGMNGLLQDFFVGGQTLSHSTLIKNYELRRVLEEVYSDLRRFPQPLLPEGRFDALILDGCVLGQFDVLTEYEGLFKYVVASTLETPYYSIPFDEVLSPYVDWLNRVAEEGRAWDRSFEERFLKPLLVSFAASHTRGGQLAKAEKQLDAIQMMALRLDKLEPVRVALRALLNPSTGLPPDLLGRWRRGELKALERLRDSDNYADLWEVAHALERLAEQTTYRSRRQNVAALARTLKQSLGSPVQDPATTPVRIAHPTAKGAWAHVRIDELVRPRDMAACAALKALALLNDGEASIALPQFLDEKGNALHAREVACEELFQKEKEREPGKKYRPHFQHPTPILTLFGVPLRWAPEMPPAHLTEVKATAGNQVGARYLSLWLPKRGETALDVSVRLQVAGTDEAWIQPLGPQENPLSVFAGADRVERWKQAKGLRFAPYFFFWRPEDFGTAEGLYVAEVHTAGTLFKRGLGITLTRMAESADSYQGGRLPIEWVQPEGTLEEYFASLSAQGTWNTDALRGIAFYRAHRIQNTLWPDFLFNDLVNFSRSWRLHPLRHRREGRSLIQALATEE